MKLDDVQSLRMFLKIDVSCLGLFELLSSQYLFGKVKRHRRVRFEALREQLPKQILMKNSLAYNASA